MQIRIDPISIELGTIVNIVPKKNYAFVRPDCGGRDLLIHNNQICAIRSVKKEVCPDFYEFFRIRYDLTLFSANDRIVFFRPDKNSANRADHKILAWCSLFHYETTVLGKGAKVNGTNGPLPAPVACRVLPPQPSSSEITLPPRWRNESDYHFKNRLKKLGFM